METLLKVKLLVASYLNVVQISNNVDIIMYFQQCYMKVVNSVVNIVYYIATCMDDLILIEYSPKAYCTKHTHYNSVSTDDGRKTKSINLSLAIYYSQLQ